MKGTLYLCGTPLGNMGDITYRCVEILSQSDFIAAEDTRNTGKLLSKLEIDTPMISYHEHNKHQKGKVLINYLNDGKNIALVSDAGMPAISDPGEDLVRLCYENDIPVSTAPSGCAFVIGLVLSGFDTRRFIFEGFLPMDKKEKRQVLSSIEKEHRTLIFYEAPHRLLDTLNEFSQTLGTERNIAVCRELTKKFEEVKKGTISEMLEHFTNVPPKGEFVIVLEGYSLAQQRQEEIEDFNKISIEEHMEIYLSQGLSEKDSMKKVAKDRGVGKSDIYKVWKS